MQHVGILVPRPGIEPASLEMEPWSPNHWTAREERHTKWITKQIAGCCAYWKISFHLCPLGPLLSETMRQEKPIFVSTSIALTPLCTRTALLPLSVGWKGSAPPSRMRPYKYTEGLVLKQQMFVMWESVLPFHVIYWCLLDLILSILFLSFYLFRSTNDCYVLLTLWLGNYLVLLAIKR